MSKKKIIILVIVIIIIFYVSPFILLKGFVKNYVNYSEVLCKAYFGTLNSPCKGGASEGGGTVLIYCDGNVCNSKLFDFFEKFKK